MSPGHHAAGLTTECVNRVVECFGLLPSGQGQPSSPHITVTKVTLFQTDRTSFMTKQCTLPGAIRVFVASLSKGPMMLTSSISCKPLSLGGQVSEFFLASSRRCCLGSLHPGFGQRSSVCAAGSAATPIIGPLEAYTPTRTRYVVAFDASRCVMQVADPPGKIHLEGTHFCPPLLRLCAVAVRVADLAGVSAAAVDTTAAPEVPATPSAPAVSLPGEKSLYPQLRLL